MPYVSVKHPDGSVEDFELKKDKALTAGRGGDNIIYIHGDSKISTHHCKIYFNEDREGFMLSDLNSTNGTFLNMQKVGFDWLLADNDKIKIGDALLIFKSSDVNHEQTTTTKKVFKGPARNEVLSATDLDIGASLHRKPLHTFANDFTLATGERVGCYQVHSKLAELKFGSVHLAHKEGAPGTPLRIGIFNAVFDMHHPAIDEFNNCLLSLSKIDNPYFVKILGGGVHLGHCYYVAEHVEAESLADKLSRNGPFEEMEALSIVYTIASALDSLHCASGMIHGRLSPSCILIDKDDNLMIEGHGLASWMIKHLSEGKPAAHPAFSSPEQALRKHFDWQSDQYTLGIMLFQLICGALPFEGDCAEQTLEMQAEAPLPAPTTVTSNVQVSPEIVRMLVNMTAKEPENRFSSWQEFMIAAEGISGQEAG